MHVEIYAPDQYSGDLMGNLSSRRGKISGSESRAGSVVIKAQVPLLRNAQLRKRIDFNDAGTRQLLDGIFALRLRPR